MSLEDGEMSLGHVDISLQEKKQSAISPLFLRHFSRSVPVCTLMCRKLLGRKTQKGFHNWTSSHPGIAHDQHIDIPTDVMLT